MCLRVTIIEKCHCRKEKKYIFFHFMLQLLIYHWVLVDYIGGLLLTKHNISFSSRVDNCIKVS